MIADRLAERDILVGHCAGAGEGGVKARRRRQRLSSRAIVSSAHCRFTAVGRVAARAAQAASRLSSEGSARIASATP